MVPVRALLLSVGLALFAACTGQPEPYAGERSPDGDPTPPVAAFDARVDRVVDGDTLIATRAGRELRVRLIGIDAPESVAPGQPVECFGPESSRALTGLLAEGAPVRAAYQDGGRQDRFGRELWDVWTADGTFVQAELVRVGAAEARAYPPHTAYAKLLEEIEVEARAADLGRWGACQ